MSLPPIKQQIATLHLEACQLLDRMELLNMDIPADTDPDLLRSYKRAFTKMQDVTINLHDFVIRK